MDSSSSEHDSHLDVESTNPSESRLLTCPMTEHRVKLIAKVSLFLLLIVLVGCSDPSSTTPTDSKTATTTATNIATATLQATPTIVRPIVTPLAQSAAYPPIALEIPAIHLKVNVVPMGWQVTSVNGVRRAEWQLPLEEAGWHINSGKVGSDQAVVLSGHHRLGAHVFAPIAQGGVQIGQEIWLTDAQKRVWVYTVSTISQPIPVSGASKAERAQLQSYLEPISHPQLVLLTGWPDFSDTHYLAVVADLTGRR